MTALRNSLVCPIYRCHLANKLGFKDDDLMNEEIQNKTQPHDDGEKTVYHAGQRRDFTVKGSFGYAFAGIAYAFRTQRNFKIHLAIGILVVILGFLLQIDFVSWALIWACIVAMFATELLNTSIESVVDMVSPEWSELAKRAKDCAAGAVCIVAFGSVVIGCIIFIPKLLSMFF